MINITAVKTVNGDRVEVNISLPDSAQDVLARNINDLSTALNYIARRAADQAAENCFVAKKDLSDMQMRAQLATPPAGPRGPDQVAFAGTKVPAVEIPDTGNEGAR